jgi:hypothetical protein
VLTTARSQWNTSFGAPQIQSSPPSVAAQTSSLNVGSAGGVDATGLQDMHGQLRTGSQMPPPHYPSAPPVQTFVTPAMWQESVASVYEGGLKRAWDYDAHMPVKRH